MMNFFGGGGGGGGGGALFTGAEVEAAASGGGVLTAIWFEPDPVFCESPDFALPDLLDFFGELGAGFSAGICAGAVAVIASEGDGCCDGV